jgi:prepilin-type N-terminal cleavage/methylation domain-containing protein
MSAEGIAASRRSRPAFSLMEILVAVALLAMLGPALLSMRTQNQKSLAGLPGRLFALYYAFDLMEEQLARPYGDIRSISERRLTDFVWVKKNIEALETELTGPARERATLSRDFLGRFVAGVKVTTTAAGKRLRVTVRWNEQGLERVHLLDGAVDK